MPLKRGDGRGTTAARLGLLAAALAVVLAAAALLSRLTTRPPEARPDGRPHVVATAAPVGPEAAEAPADARRSPTPAPPPTPAREEPERRSTVTLAWRGETTPLPATRTEPESARHAAATPTPSVARCVSVTWSSSMSPAAPGQVLVEVTASNRCGRDLEPMEVFFLVSGYRHGALVRSVTGHPFDPLPRGGRVATVIGLPGSIDWYDRIDVEVIDAGS